jgi:hypothetical protein
MCPLSPLHQNLSDFLGEEIVLYLTPLPPPPTLKINGWYSLGWNKLLRYTRNTLGTF